MTIFASDYTARGLEGTGALIFKIVNTLLTIVPMIILTIILYLLFKILLKSMQFQIFF